MWHSYKNRPFVSTHLDSTHLVSTKKIKQNFVKFKKNSSVYSWSWKHLFQPYLSTLALICIVQKFPVATEQTFGRFFELRFTNAKKMLFPPEVKGNPDLRLGGMPTVKYFFGFLLFYMYMYLLFFGKYFWDCYVLQWLPEAREENASYASSLCPPQVKMSDVRRNRLLQCFTTTSRVLIRQRPAMLERFTSVQSRNVHRDSGYLCLL